MTRGRPVSFLEFCLSIMAVACIVVFLLPPPSKVDQDSKLIGALIVIAAPFVFALMYNAHRRRR
jgi:hypothetical protein